MISRNKHIELKTTKHQKGIQKENELIRELCEMKFKEWLTIKNILIINVPNNLEETNKNQENIRNLQ